jgi:uncharacterized protein YbaP (TraB family)
MKRHIAHLAALFAIVLAWSASAQVEPTPPATILAPMEAHPALWTVHGKKGTAYLFGSIHVLPPQVDWRTKEIDAAIAKADAFVFELPVDTNLQSYTQDYLLTRGTLPPGQHLRDMLSPKARAIFDKEIAGLPMSPAEFDRMRPWHADVTIDVLEMEKQHYSPEAGIEARLKKEAAARAKPVIGLETIQQQLALLAPDDPKVELENFESDLEHASKDNDEIGPLLDAWMQGDVRTLAHLTAADMKDYPKLRKVLVEDRNQAWVTKIIALLDENKTYFIAVGAAHLVGPRGVPELLRKKGLKVDGP